MSTTVCKFGGSSVSDAVMFVRVNRIITSDSSRKYIVLSAPGKRSKEDMKVTDLFYRAYEANSYHDYTILAEIFARYASIRDSLVPSFDLETEFSRIRKNLRISLDYAASRGEYLCAKLFSAYSKMPFVDASEILLFDAEGKLDTEATYSAIKERLLPLGCAVIPGFYGSRPDGSIQTFSRGGSDISGSLIAAALKADLYENWTDVDGLYTADPAIVPDARRIPEVSISQMESICAGGAQLLHPDALAPLRSTGIETVLKNTFKPGDRGTFIREHTLFHVPCVTGKRSLYMLENNSCEPLQNALLHELPVCGSVRVACVNIFGMNSEKSDHLRRILNPIHFIHMQNHIQIIVPESEYENTVRTAHAILME